MSKTLTVVLDLQNRHNSLRHQFLLERSVGLLMDRSLPWFERKFDFSFPTELYPNLCARLRGTPARLDEIVSASSRGQLIAKRDAGWSAQEHAGHLLDLEALWAARVEDFATRKTELATADLNNRKTHEANHNATAADEILKKFRASRSGMMRLIEAMDPALFGSTSLHPRLKQPMRMVDHLYFVAEHDDHHLARIFELLQGGDGRDEAELKP